MDVAVRLALLEKMCSFLRLSIGVEERGVIGGIGVHVEDVRGVRLWSESSSGENMPKKKPKPGTKAFGEQARRRRDANKAGFRTSGAKDPINQATRVRKNVSVTSKERKQGGIRLQPPDPISAAKAQIKRALRKKPSATTKPIKGKSTVTPKPRRFIREVEKALNRQGVTKEALVKAKAKERKKRVR